MGFNRRRIESERNAKAEAEAAARRATDAQVVEDAERLIGAWNEREGRRMPLLFAPTIGVALASRHHFLWVYCPACHTMRDIDLRMLVAIPWTDEADAIRMANDSHYGLAAYVWSHDIGRALRTAHAIEAGWVQVNQGLGQSPGHSYGGYKQSGIGREFSLEGMLESYTQRKNVTVNLAR